MAVSSHLNSLQALELALRAGSLSAAADQLGITPAAVGQRIRALENYLGTDLLVRGRSGIYPTPELSEALPSLRVGFEALDRATEQLNFQRVSEIHVLADPDWAELWLEPRMADFRDAHPNILFCINGAGDIPTRLGAPDLRIESGPEATGTELFTDYWVPVCSKDNVRRIADYHPENEMEGLPLLHLRAAEESDRFPGWEQWFSQYGLREKGTDRGPHYQHARIALEAARTDVGFLLCGLSLAERDLSDGKLLLPYPPSKGVWSPYPYRLKLRDGVSPRPQMQRFIDWLVAGAAETGQRIAAQAAST